MSDEKWLGHCHLSVVIVVLLEVGEEIVCRMMDVLLRARCQPLCRRSSATTFKIGEEAEL